MAREPGTKPRRHRRRILTQGLKIFDFVLWIRAAGQGPNSDGHSAMSDKSKRPFPLSRRLGETSAFTEEWRPRAFCSRCTESRIWDACPGRTYLCGSFSENLAELGFLSRGRGSENIRAVRIGIPRKDTLRWT